MNIDDYVFINRTVLKFVGLYPTSVVKYLTCTLCMSLIVVPQIMQICKNWNDLEIVLETSSVLFTIVLAILKSLVWISRRRNMEPFIDFMLTYYWEFVADTQFSKYLSVYAVFARKVTKAYLFLICNALAFFFSLPLIETLISRIQGTDDNSTMHFPFIALYPESYYSFPMYEVVYVSQMIATFICGLVIMATDTFIATAILHTCGHFKILQEDLKELDTNLVFIGHGQNSSEKCLQDIRQQINRIIKHHQIILWFCDHMEKNFNPILFLQTLASSLIICLVGLQISNRLEEQYKMIEYFSYLVMALSQLLLFCFPGDSLISQSSAVSKTMYAVNWYEFPSSIKSEVCLIMMRSQKPSYITAGKFYVMHLENFSAILSTSLSYFMVLRSFNAEDNDINL